MLKALLAPVYLTVSQAARELHISAQTLREWTEQGRIDAYLTEGNHRRYLQAEVRLLAAREQARMRGWDASGQIWRGSASVSRQGEEECVLFTYREGTAGEVPLTQLRTEHLNLSLSPFARQRLTDYPSDYSPQADLNPWVRTEGQYLYTGQAQSYLSELELGWGTRGAWVERHIYVLAESEAECGQILISRIEEVGQQLRGLRALPGIISFQSPEDGQL